MTRTGHHAVALDANGRSLPDKVWGWDMPVLADFSPCTWKRGDVIKPGRLTADIEPVWDDSIDTLADAHEWAAKVFESDSRVASVSIRESIQDYDGAMWHEGRCVDTVRREVPPAPTCQGGQHIFPGGFRCACGAISTD